MAEYCLYILDRRGRIARRIDLRECIDDDHARGIAVAYPHQAGMELWQGDRLVQTYESPDMD